jgi:hypothetical protein
LAIERPVLPRVSGQSLRAAWTRHRQRSRRLLSRREASRHTRRACRRPRNTEYGDSDPRGHWYQATRLESRRYRGRSSDRVGAETNVQTEGEGTKRKREKLHIRLLPPTQKAKKKVTKAKVAGAQKNKKNKEKKKNLKVGAIKVAVLLAAVKRLTTPVRDIMRNDEMSSKYSRRGP